MFHLITHAFFKALLFMGAGVVIHALADEQDIRQMGGLQQWLPRTAICMWIGTLALAGVFPLSGGISKDAILASGLELGGFWGMLAFIGGVVGALLTGLYASRLMFVVFRGQPSEYAAEHAPHHTEHGEGPRTMLIPVYILTSSPPPPACSRFPASRTSSPTGSSRPSTAACRCWSRRRRTTGSRPSWPPAPA